MSLTLHGWIGPQQQRLAVELGDGEMIEVLVPDPIALVARIAGVATPHVWLHLDGVELGRLDPAVRARAGLATVTGELPASADLRILDLVLIGRALPGRFGFMGLGTERLHEYAAQREADARALAGTLGLGPIIDQPAASLDDRAAPIVDVARALLAEPRALVAAVPQDDEAAAWLRSRLAAEAARRAMPILLLAKG